MRDPIQVLLAKTFVSIKKDGFGPTISRMKGYIRIQAATKKIDGADNLGIYGDVLFINGCFLPHPVRYRVSHQREQLLAKNIYSSEILYTDITMDLVDKYRTFVFYRCPYTDAIGSFIDKLHAAGKKAIFDMDDLLIDRKYTETISYIKTMSDAEQKVYYDQIDDIAKTLKRCDCATTSTEALANELRNYLPDVYVNRNLASDKMLRLSQLAVAKRELAKKKDDITIGYFSGSITHNEDVEDLIPVLRDIFASNPQVKLLLVGEIEIPSELSDFRDRIIFKKFVDWKLLPELIASVDINIIPLKDTLFNQAKSENKWTEASLVKVPTIASNVGALHDSIQDGQTGLLVDTQDQWKEAIQLLIDSEEERKRLAANAYQCVLDNYITITHDNEYANFIRSQYKPSIAFVLPEIQVRGGIMVALKHAAFMKDAGYDAFIVTVNENQDPVDSVKVDDCVLPVIDRNKIRFEGSVDKAVATLWSTVPFIEKYQNLKERYYLVQNYETDFVDPDTKLRTVIEKTYNSTSNLKYVTISKWCQNWLQERYGQTSKYAMNGIDTEKFYPCERKFDSKIKILIEGNSNDSYKNVDESFKIVDLLDKDKYEIWYLSYEGQPKKEYYVDEFLHVVPFEQVAEVYRKCDILLKTSVLESFSYPPLEMMATGGYVVAVPNGGNAEYLVDDYNCLLYKQGDLQQAVSCIEKIANDSTLREKLYQNGMTTVDEHKWLNIREAIIVLYK